MLERFEKNPLAFILIIAGVLRVTAGLYNNTPAQEDDYANVISPALNALQTGAPITVADYRWEVFPQLFYGIMAFFRFLGVDSYGTLVSLGLATIGLISLSFVWGMYLLAGNFLSDKWRNMFGLLMATYFLFPFAQTRTFLESFTLTTVPWCFYFLTKEDRDSRDLFWSAFFLGITVLLRLQAALFPITCSFIVLCEAFRKQLDWRRAGFFFLGGAASLIILAAADLSSGRYPFATIFAYLDFGLRTNIQSSTYGSQPWYTHFGVLLTVFIPPLSLALVYPFVKALNRSWVLTLNLAVFVLVHSFVIQHKLERYILPTVPLFMLITVIGLEKLKDVRWLQLSFKAFWVSSLLLLLPATLARSQSNIIDAAIYLQNVKDLTFIKGIDLWKQGYLGYHRARPHSLDTVEQLIEQANHNKLSVFYVLNFLALPANEVTALKESGYQCLQKRAFHPALMEKLVIMANPHQNNRRRSTFLYRCERG